MTDIAARRSFPLLSPANILFVLGVVAIIVPTMMFVAQESWSQETGAHGPIVLFTGLWLLRRRWVAARPVMKAPPTLPVLVLAAIFLPLFVFARVTQIIEIEGYLMYGLVLISLYSVVGKEAMKVMWFPLFYLVFVFPPPDTLIALITQPLKIVISQAAIGFLHMLGYPIGGAGVMIQIGQYQLLVAAACSGLNSLVSLSAISLFYIYVRHQANWRYALLLGLMIIPVAVIANFIRVLILILLTYHLGEAAAQGFLHNFAGITMFLAAVLTIFAIDSVLEPIWRRIYKTRSPE
ncbi:exosortase V [Parasphingorhabdus sp.]|uniref:exosortase V n=1 Tax=Parasphingorhabdus sp. TaxID=2709688 RepID=UPI0032665533